MSPSVSQLMEVREQLLNVRMTQSKQIEREAVLENLEGKAEAIIWMNVVANAGMGAVPLGINTWTFIGANTAMIVALGHLYGYTLTKERAGALLRQMFSAVGLTWAASILGMKFFAEILKGAGVITMGGATVGGMALDAVLCGAISYAIGYTSKMYFVNGCSLTSHQMSAEFKKQFAEGKTRVQREIKNKMKGA
jgi:uncharacterized protein (DUF697 family)